MAYGQMFDTSERHELVCAGSRKLEPTNHCLSSDLMGFLKSVVPMAIGHSGDQLRELNSTVSILEKMMSGDIFKEISNFIWSLSAFLNGKYSERSSHIEPFQKQLILHTLCFIVSIKCTANVDSYMDVFKAYFGLDDVRSDVVALFKQRASVFIIPRRHGKTWIIVAIISILLLTVDGINVGYVAHQKHVVNVVFEDIRKTMIRICPAAGSWLDVRKENSTISVKRPGWRGSMLMCATCFNKNVSIYSSSPDIGR